MNSQERAKHALPLVQALAEGKVIQGRHKTQPGVVWEDLELTDPWYLAFEYFDFRVKPEDMEVTLIYRRAIMRHNKTGIYGVASAWDEKGAEAVENYGHEGYTFIRWIDKEWQYEVTTVPAQT